MKTHETQQQDAEKVLDAITEIKRAYRDFMVRAAYQLRKTEVPMLAWSTTSEIIEDDLNEMLHSEWYRSREKAGGNYPLSIPDSNTL